MPATTSSPCSFMRHSAKNFFCPVDGSLVKPTPVPELSPRLPNTIDWMLHAVPRLSGISFNFLYLAALSPNHEPKTALTAFFSCSKGSVGKSSPVFFLYMRHIQNVHSRSF